MLEADFCKELTNNNKKDTNLYILLLSFLAHLQENHSDSIHIYTDGHKSQDWVGYAAVTTECPVQIRIATSASIYAAELYAIHDALEIISNSRNFAIISDSISALQAIEQYNSDHPIVSSIQDWLIRVGSRKKRVKLCWSPSHINITGNEKADKEASNTVVVV